MSFVEEHVHTDDVYQQNENYNKVDKTQIRSWQEQKHNSNIATELKATIMRKKFPFGKFSEL